MDYNRDVEYDNRINDKIKKQMDYMEEKDYRRKEEKKLRYKQALDKQMDQQRIRKKWNMILKMEISKKIMLNLLFRLNNYYY